jgi:hypothetical protein
MKIFHLKNKLLLIFLFSCFCLFLSACNDEKPTIEKEQEVVKKPQIDTFEIINYHTIKFGSNSERNEFFKQLSEKPNFSIDVMKLLNRKEWNLVKSSKTVIYPDTFLTDLRAYSFFPSYYPEAENIPKIIFVSTKYQAVAFYENGILKKFAAVNSGKERTQTYPGRYQLNFRQRTRLSSIDSNWEMNYYFNFNAEAGMAFHQFYMPGYPASHSCMRMFEEDAKWLYSWGKAAKYDSTRRPIPNTGTTVIILDHYEFGKSYRPWMDLASNKDPKLILPKNPLAVDEPLIPISQIPQDVRGSLRNINRYKIAEDSLRKLGIIREGIEITPSVNFNKLRRIKKQQEIQKQKELEMQKQLEEQNNTSIEEEEINQ